MNPTISLVITSYNQAHYLQEAIASILEQTRTDFELLVWDDGSTDNSVAVAQQFAATDDRVRVVVADRQGRGKALQDAIANTTGDYLGWIDGDDRLAATALAETAAILDRHANIGMVYTNYMEMDAQGNTQQLGKRCQTPYSPERLLVDFMTFHFRLVRRSAFEQAGGIDAEFEYIEDYDLCLRLSETTEIYHLPKPLYFYRLHAGNTSKDKQLEQVVLSHKAIANALQRRGLADTLQVEVRQGKFYLRPRSPFPAAGQKAKQKAMALAMLPFALPLVPIAATAADISQPKPQTEVVSSDTQNGDRRALNLSNNDEENLIGQGYGDDGGDGYGGDGGDGYGGNFSSPRATMVAKVADTYVDRSTINITPDGNIVFADDEA